MQAWTTTTQLLRRLDDAEDAAWSDLLGRFRAPVLHLARRCGVNEHKAQDVAQNTMLAFTQQYRAGRYDPERGGLRTWLFAIAWRESQQARRELARDAVQPPAGSGRTTFMSAQPDEGEVRDAWELEWERAVLRQCLDQVRLEVSTVSSSTANWIPADALARGSFRYTDPPAR